MALKRFVVERAFYFQRWIVFYTPPKYQVSYYTLSLCYLDVFTRKSLFKMFLLEKSY